MRTDVKVGDCMTVGVITARGEHSVEEIAKILKKADVSGVVIMENDEIIGIVAESDITFKVVAEGKNPKEVTAKEIMSAPVTTISAENNIEEAVHLLKENKIKRLPVVNENGKLIGIITEGDLVKVYPGLIDVLRETAEICRFGEEESFTGVCECCGNFSEILRRSGGKLACEECIEEEKI